MTCGRADSQSSCLAKKILEITRFSVTTILSARPFDIGTHARTVFQHISFAFMKFLSVEDLKYVALSDKIVRGGPKYG